MNTRFTGNGSAVVRGGVLVNEMYQGAASNRRSPAAPAQQPTLHRDRNDGGTGSSLPELIARTHIDPADGAIPPARVYVVDDHALTRHGMVMLIDAEADMQVCGESDNAAVALAEIIKHKPDVVVVDLSLRGTSGLELIKNVRAQSADIRILVVSMHDEALYAPRVLKAGARGYVMKNEEAGTLIRAIRRVRHGRLAVSEAVVDRALTHGPSPAAGDSPMAGLSDRELEIVELIGNGLATRQIASRLHVSVKTVETHRAHIKTKLHIENATRLVQVCARWVEQSTAAAGAQFAGYAGSAA